MNNRLAPAGRARELLRAGSHVYREVMATTEQELHQLAAQLQCLSNAVSALALGLRPQPTVPLRPWWDAPVHGLPLEEALKQYGESQASR